jgi:LPS sulfotransferase NodH
LAGYEVQAVSLLPERNEHLLGLELDAPAVGNRRNTYVLHLIGWVVGRERQVESVEVVYHERVLRTVPVRGPRDDVAATLGIPPETDCVFHALVGLIGLKLEAKLSLRVVMEDGARVQAGSITVRREPLRTDHEPRLAPLMITTLGRSGSTWLMQILASHPEIVAFRHFPYESAPAKYWLHALRVLCEPANFSESAQPDTFHNNLWWVGNNPYHDDRVYEQVPLETWFAQIHPERFAVFCQQTIEDWYMTLARTQVQPSPKYFAEKHMWPNYLPVLTWELYPRAKEVILVRDFRDMARSIMAFDEKRGYAGFGRPDGVSDEQYMRGELRQMAQDLRKSWQTRRDRAHLVRYEDLVLQPVETLTAMLEYLEIDASAGTVQEVLARGAEEILRLPGVSYEISDIRVHRTVGDPKATIGRWRRESDESFRELAHEVFGEALEEFGYPSG